MKDSLKKSINNLLCVSGLLLLSHGMNMAAQTGIESLTRSFGAKDKIQSGIYLGTEITQTRHGTFVAKGNFITSEGANFEVYDVPQVFAGKQFYNSVLGKLEKGHEYNLQIVGFDNLNTYNVLVEADKR